MAQQIQTEFAPVKMIKHSAAQFLKLRLSIPES
jgi:hypothetical protein